MPDNAFAKSRYRTSQRQEKKNIGEDAESNLDWSTKRLF